MSFSQFFSSDGKQEARRSADVILDNFCIQRMNKTFGIVHRALRQFTYVVIAEIETKYLKISRLDQIHECPSAFESH